MALSLKVPVVDLIAKAEAERAGIIAKHDAALSAHRAAVTSARKELATKLRERAKNIAKAKLTYNRGWNGSPDTASVSGASVPCPPHPGNKPDTSRIDRDLRLLRATSETDIRVRVDSDLARYL